MDIHEQADEILSHADYEEHPASEYEIERARHFIEQAKAQQEAGEWKLADIKTFIMENPMPGMYSLQFWFIILHDEKSQRIAGAIFSETRD